MSPARVAWSAVGIIAGVAVVVTLLGFALGWFGRAVEVVSPDNVEEQYRAVIEDWESLQTAAANACHAADASAGAEAPVLVEGPGLAYEATYRRIAVDYNRRQANLFEAKIAGPRGYPDRAPSTGADTDWCALADELAAAGAS